MGLGEVSAKGLLPPPPTVQVPNDILGWGWGKSQQKAPSPLPPRRSRVYMSFSQMKLDLPVTICMSVCWYCTSLQDTLYGSDEISDHLSHTILSSAAMGNPGIIHGYVHQSGPVLPWAIPGSSMALYTSVWPSAAIGNPVSLMAIPSSRLFPT